MLLAVIRILLRFGSNLAVRAHCANSNTRGKQLACFGLEMHQPAHAARLHAHSSGWVARFFARPQQQGPGRTQ
jgi:hypothetical protein